MRRMFKKAAKSKIPTQKKSKHRKNDSVLYSMTTVQFSSSHKIFTMQPDDSDYGELEHDVMKVEHIDHDNSDNYNHYDEDIDGETLDFLPVKVEDMYDGITEV